jgi:hypothetical protein
MLLFPGTIRRSFLTALGLSAAFILASCGEEVLSPPTENFSPGVPIYTFSSEFAQYQFLDFVKDDAGANDTPAQSDLNAFTRADNVSGKIAVKWVWDDVNSWTGTGSTGDACALFDTTPANANKGKGFANFAVCVRITNTNQDPNLISQLAPPASPLLYSCGDTKADRCASSTKLLQSTGIVCEVEKQAGEAYFATGDDGADVVAACSIPLSIFGQNVSANLLNVCSFPSGSPNSNPFDCVVTPGAGFIVIKKATTPQNSGETFSFTITPAPAGGGSQSLKDSSSNDEQTALIAALPGTKAYSVAETTIPANWSLNTATCAFDRAGSPSTGTKIGSKVDSVSVESGETTICTFTNSRNQGTIELKKVWSGGGGQTTLRIGTSANGSETASQLTGASGATPLTTGAQSVNTGTYYVSESGGLDDYTSQLACTNKGNSITPGTDNAITVSTGDVIVCTFTNTRNQGSIELKKSWSGTPGQATLKIGTSSGGSEISSTLTGAAGAGPLTTGVKNVNTGTYYVSESAPANYTSALACTKNATPFTPGAGNSMSIATGDVVVCTFTNTRDQGSIELKKVWSGGDPGQTTLQIGTSAGGSQTAGVLTGSAGGAPLTTTAKTVNTGTYYLSESGGLTNYSSQLDCTSDNVPISPDSNNGVTVAKNAVVVCTFTNTRATGSIELKKIWSGSAGGQTTLNIGTTSGGSNVKSKQTGAGGTGPLTTDPQGVNTGTYYVSESGGLTAYTPSLSCTSNGIEISSTGGAVAVASGATVVCTFTNTAKTPTITVVKTPGASTVPETGGNVTYSILVTNTSTFPVTLTSLTDDKFGNLSGKGTCNDGAHPYGILAANGTYSCSFTGALPASEAGRSHVNIVTASASSEVGNATAKDTASVGYSDVLPNISVLKSADYLSIAAVGGDSVDGFNEDARYERSGTGGAGGGGLTFASNICDDQGANDINSAQSDLNCFSRADNVSGHLGLKWSWDAVAQWTGTGSTGDACALLDINNDGTANFAFCVRITNPNGDPTKIAQAAGSPVLYKCKDSAPDRCSSPNSIQPINLSTCSVSRVPNRMAGGEDFDDIEATCDVTLTDLGNNVNIANVDLLNVCSFPSGSPGSNAFDCVILPAAGLLVLQETTVPANANAFFAFTLRNGNNTAGAAATNGFNDFEVQGGATSPGIPILPGTYAIAQQVPTNWSLGSITCTRDGNVVGTSDLAHLAKLSVPIVSGSTTLCVFNNSLSASQTVTFTVTVTNNSLEAVNMYSLEDAEDPDSASPTYVTLSGVGTCNSASNLYGSIAPGGTYVCTFTRTVSGVPGTQHKDKVRAVGKDNEFNGDTKISNTVTVSIN